MQVQARIFFSLGGMRKKTERRDRGAEKEREREESGWEDGPKQRQEIHIN